MAADAPPVEAFYDQEISEVPVSGFLHRATAPSKDSLILTHGAGGNCNAPLLVALGESFSAAGINVLRCDLPFRQKRPHGPPSPGSAKSDQEGLRRATELVRKKFGARIFLGGQSYGGRQASMLAASDSSATQALLLLSYPLHPPGKPQQLRTAHLPKLGVPTVFVSGTKDPFGSIEELESARALIPARTELLAIEGAGHSLLTKSNQAELVSSITVAFQKIVKSDRKLL